MHPLAQRVLQKEMAAAARVMRLIDDRTHDAVAILKDLYPHTGRAFVIGVTGNPGAGKSTLCDRLIERIRAEKKTVGVIAVDPTSPYSGGAILGDRIRMGRHATDEGVFIRSVATRGHLGGLSRSARDMVRVLDAYGCDVVLLETVGVGQDELEITRTAHSTLVVMAPGMGDDVQAIKAGILECADVFAVNKADRDGADSTVRDLEMMIAMGRESTFGSAPSRGHAGHSAMVAIPTAKEDDERWTPPILRAIATRNEGVLEILDALSRHYSWLQSSEVGRARRRLRLSEEVRDMLREVLIEEASRAIGSHIEEAVRAVDAKEIDPYTATERLVSVFIRA